MAEKDEPLNPNPIVAMAMKLRARKDLAAVIEAGAEQAPAGEASTVGTLRRFGDDLQLGCKRLGAILGKGGVTFVRLENPLRLRLRFRDARVTFDLDAARELIVVAGAGLDGEYAVDPAAPVATLINLSKLSTDEGYARGITAVSVLKELTADAQLPRPAHLDGPGPLPL